MEKRSAAVTPEDTASTQLIAGQASGWRPAGPEDSPIASRLCKPFGPPLVHAAYVHFVDARRCRPRDRIPPGLIQQQLAERVCELFEEGGNSKVS